MGKVVDNTFDEESPYVKLENLENGATYMIKVKACNYAKCSVYTQAQAF